MHQALPPGTFDRSLHAHLELQERRVRAMYNRTRALFAESLVASLLPRATVVEDPAAAWDVSWPQVGGDPLRIEVKCSGERLPRLPGRRAPARWDLPEPRVGWDPDRRVKLPVARHWDVVVCARHEGADISRGWMFHVLAGPVTRSRRVTPAHLVEMGATRCQAEDLADVVAAAAAAGLAARLSGSS